MYHQSSHHQSLYHQSSHHQSLYHQSSHHQSSHHQSLYHQSSHHQSTLSFIWGGFQPPKTYSSLHSGRQNISYGAINTPSTSPQNYYNIQYTNFQPQPQQRSLLQFVYSGFSNHDENGTVRICV